MDEIPSSVYRLQMNKNFSLKKATALLSYLFDLGIESFNHDYDITNPCRLNPDLGSLADFEDFCSQMRKYKMKLLLDIVPNHMGIKGNKNLWWIDVLEKGQSSTFANIFDINWTPEKLELQGKILLPILDKPYEQVLKERQIELFWEKGFWVRYFDYLLPICYSTYPRILENGQKDLSFEKNKEWLKYLLLANSGSKEQFISFYDKSFSVQNCTKNILSSFNKNSNLLHKLLENQFYRLAYWVIAGQEINYRRFFNINELIAIHIENEQVLNMHHNWIFDLISLGKVQGLRIDHPDGLYDPSQYFERVRKKKPAFIWIEKILDFKEPLPELWNVDGTVGYDFLNILSGMFIQRKNKKKFTEIYARFIEKEINFKETCYACRKRYLTSQMSSEIYYLTTLLTKISEKSRYYRDFTKADLTCALLEIFACFPVYRTYIKPGIEIRKKDRAYILYTIETAKKKAPKVDPSIFDYIKSLLLSEYENSFKDLSIDFVLRFQQMTAPIMAKGLEDSTFYIYNRLISLNEVGGNPDYFGFSKAEFHAFNKKKLTHWPLGALASSTHDTKYSEDARLRIHILSEMPEKWKALVLSWKKDNQRCKTCVAGNLFPDLNIEYFIYQMLIALWPADQQRLQACLNKVIREVGIYTSWHKIDTLYENAINTFLKAILTPDKENTFLPSFFRFQKEIELYGILNSISALILKIGSCGIVDIYQGNEVMNHVLMDPDNRHPVDFNFRKQSLQEMKDLKISTTAKALHFRRNNKELFLKGDYITLKSPENVIAFMREWKGQQVIIIVKRFFTKEWPSCILKLPKKSNPSHFKNLFTNEKIYISKNELDIDKILRKNNFAILI